MMMIDSKPHGSAPGQYFIFMMSEFKFSG